MSWLRKKKSRTSTEATAARIRAEQQLKATREKTPMVVPLLGLCVPVSPVVPETTPW